jgi:hypothetical protein
MLEVLPEDEEPIPLMMMMVTLPYLTSLACDNQVQDTSIYLLLTFMIRRKMTKMNGGLWEQQGPNATLAVEQNNGPQQELMPDLNMVPFADLEEPMDKIDQLVVLHDLNRRPANHIVQQEHIPKQSW